ncbi:hypothetical protein BD410DRAFT_823196 [Rickenella mellea]|uniref:DUF4419 domain-containing protein n=1 Tax=Rickenella mellea TaxID=50990 RepID=A0A4Y7PI30_9AGAM|nr:hypothetical protein BD410DRAFT_823196 [Rickenella mellea]
MPVTFKVAPHAANPVRVQKDGLKSLRSPSHALAAVRFASKSRFHSNEEVLQSSLTKDVLPSFSPRDNGFVRMVVEAYNAHHNLIIRPDDVWISILGQLNFYINAHTGDLRSKFVSHDGQKELVVECYGNRRNVDFGKLANTMSEELKKNIKSPDLHELIIPNFSTTTTTDVVVASVMMMSTLKTYFAMKFSLLCGIPSITLLGTSADWSSLASRIDKIDSLDLGPEVSAWCCLLRPVVAQFVATFDHVDLSFWSTICSYKPGGSGPDFVGGWITAFCAWDKDGKWLGAPAVDIISAASTMPSQPTPTWELPPENMDPHSFAPPRRPLVYGGMTYPLVDTSDLPHGYCEVPVLVDDNGEKLNCTMLAGHVGVALSSSGGKGGQWDTLQASPEWFIFIKVCISERIPSNHNFAVQSAPSSFTVKNKIRRLIQ